MCIRDSVELAEGAVLHDVTVGAHGLFEDFLAVGDEEQLQIAARSFGQAFVVQGSDDRDWTDAKMCFHCSGLWSPT